MLISTPLSLHLHPRPQAGTAEPGGLGHCSGADATGITLPPVTCRQKLKRNFLTPSQVQSSPVRTKPCLGLPGLGWAGQVYAGHLCFCFCKTQLSPRARRHRGCAHGNFTLLYSFPHSQASAPFLRSNQPRRWHQTHCLELCGSHHTRRECSLS